MKYLVSLTMMVLLALGLIGCGEEEEAPSDLAAVYGTITFENIELWPDEGELEVTIFPEGVWVEQGGQRVPMGAPYNASNPVILEKVPGQTQYDYRIEGLPPGTYSALAVGWRHPDTTLPATRRTATLGVHWGHPDEVSTGLKVPLGPSPEAMIDDPPPEPIVLEAGDEVEINFKADFAIIPLWFPELAQQ